MCHIRWATDLVDSNGAEIVAHSVLGAQRQQQGLQNVKGLYRRNKEEGEKEI
jgi:hypothetical protein